MKFELVVFRRKFYYELETVLSAAIKDITKAKGKPYYSDVVKIQGKDIDYNREKNFLRIKFNKKRYGFFIPPKIVIPLGKITLVTFGFIPMGEHPGWHEKIVTLRVRIPEEKTCKVDPNVEHIRAKLESRPKHTTSSYYDKEWDDLEDLFEDTFNDCYAQKDELYWLSSILHIILGYDNQSNVNCLENFRIDERMFCYGRMFARLKQKHKW